MTTTHPAKPVTPRKKVRSIKTLSAASWAQITMAIRELAKPAVTH